MGCSSGPSASPPDARQRTAIPYRSPSGTSTTSVTSSAKSPKPSSPDHAHGAAQQIAKGYSGEDFVTHLARAWHIDLHPFKGKTLQGAPDDGLKGTTKTASGVRLKLSTDGDASGMLYILRCEADGISAQAANCICACARLDLPGGDPDEQEAWARRSVAYVKSSYNEADGVVIAPSRKTSNTISRLDGVAARSIGGTGAGPALMLAVSGLGA